MVDPEHAVGAPANRTGGGGPENGADVRVMQDVKVAPGPRGVRALKPKPSCPKGNAHALQVTDAQSAQGKWAANSLPVNETLATVCVLASSSEKSTDDVDHFLEDELVKGNGGEEVGRDGAEDMTDKRKPITSG